MLEKRYGLINGVYVYNNSKKVDLIVRLENYPDEIYGLKRRSRNDMNVQADKKIFDIALLAFNMEKPLSLKVEYVKTDSETNIDNLKRYYIMCAGMFTGKLHEQELEATKPTTDEEEKKKNI